MATHLVKITLPDDGGVKYRLAFNKGDGFWQIDLSPNLRRAPNENGKSKRFWLRIEDGVAPDIGIKEMRENYFAEDGHPAFFAAYMGEEVSPGHSLTFATRDALAIDEDDSVEHLVGKVRKPNGRVYTQLGILTKVGNNLGGGFFNDPDWGDQNKEGYAMVEEQGGWALKALPKGHKLVGGKRGAVIEGQPSKAAQADLAGQPNLSYVAPAPPPQRGGFRGRGGNRGNRGNRGGGRGRGGRGGPPRGGMGGPPPPTQDLGSPKKRQKTSHPNDD